MNKKGNNAWILCPSKSFPGKLYYFNVITGEAAWCLSEEEKKALAKDVAMKKVSDKGHSYPEPNTPPTEDRPDISNICYNFTSPPTIPLNYHMGPPQIFDQSVVPKYIPNQYLPSYVIPMPQMFVANKPEPKKRSFDQITQTSDVQIPCTQGYTIPLSKRFGTYREVKIGTKTFENKGDSTSYKDNQCNTNYRVNFANLQSNVFGPKLNKPNVIYTTPNKQNPFKCNVNNTITTHNKKLIRDPILISINTRQNMKLHNFSVYTANQKQVEIKKSVLTGNQNEIVNKQMVTEKTNMNVGKEYCLKKTIFNNKNSAAANTSWSQIKMCEDLPKKPYQRLALNLDDRLVSFSDEINEIEYDIDEIQKHLNRNDLRFVLQAKRRKFNFDDMVTPVQTKDIFSSTAHFGNNVNKIKEKSKQVSFDFENLREANIELETPTPIESEVQTLDSEIDETNSPIPQVLNISYLKSLAKSSLKTDPWYVVVDVGVLLDDFEFIMDLVKKDITCRLLVPNSVRSYIETMSVGEYGGRSLVLLARKAMRRLAAMENYIVLQPPIMDTASPSAIDGTIECCLQVLKCHHAVLITTDTELYGKAASSGINTYKLDDIKKSCEGESLVSFDIGTNAKVNGDNIFLQNKDSFEVFPLSKKDCFPVNDSDIFKVPTIVRDSQTKRLETIKIDTTNSIVFSNSYNVTESKPSNKIKIDRRKVDFNKQINSNIEDDIKLLSLNENGTQKNKLSDKFKRISQRSSNFNVRKVIINTSGENNRNKDEKNLKSEWVMLKEDLNPSLDEFGKKAKSLTVSIPFDNNLLVRERYKTKINAYTIEDLLKRFQVKDGDMSQRVEARLEEWTCCFCQIMEECLSDVLRNNTQGTRVKFAGPWTLFEAVICLREVYAASPGIKTIADKLCDVLSNLSDKNGNLNKKIDSVDFMKLFGCGVLLVESLKSMLPQSEQVVESAGLLTRLLQRMQERSADTDLPYTPLRVVRSDMDDTECLKRNIIMKKPSEILEYLKIHFPAWKDFDERHLPPENPDMEKIVVNENTVVRTFGKNLNTIRINKAKKITFDNDPSIKTSEFKENIENKDLPQILRRVDNKRTDIDEVNTIEEYKNKKANENRKRLSASDGKNNNTIVVTDTRQRGQMGDEESLDYEEFLPTDDNFGEDMMCVDDNVNFTANDDSIQNDEDIMVFDDVNDKVPQGADGRRHHNDSTDDSGFVNQSLDACSFIRMFLMELSASFKLIYNFIDDSIDEVRRDVVQLEDKKVIYDKANETHLYVADIIGKLKRIVNREANKNTPLKSLIVNAGLTDKRITRYRQVTMKCLEQAQLLEGALKTMLALTNEHCDITAVEVDSAAPHAHYYNIFE